jgi:hypothetical protein
MPDGKQTGARRLIRHAPAFPFEVITGRRTPG